MRSGRPLRLIGLTILAAGIAAAGAFGLRALGPGAAEKGSGDETLIPAIRTRQAGDEIRLLLSPGAQAAAGLIVEALQAADVQQRRAALATIVSPQALLDRRRAYQQASADAARGALATRTARLELQRLQKLHGQDRIVSDKTLETAEVQAATEDTAARLADSQLALQVAAQRQQWGPVIGGWLINGGPAFDRMMSGQDVLVQIALPAGTAVDPRTARLELSPGDELDVPVISCVPLADPKFQAPGFYAIAPARPFLLPGMTVQASVPIGAPVRGTDMPEGALVRWRGQAFAYVEAADGEFVRRPVPTEIATHAGWLVRSGLPAGTRVVVRGAQLLLSEEMQAASGGGESE